MSLRNSRDRQREETRRKLYVAALEVFRREGVEAARIEEIAAAVGVSRGTFYLYFPTKDDVLAELFAEVEAGHLAELQAIAADAPLSVFIEGLCDSMAARWQDDPRLFVDMGLMFLRRAHTQVRPERRDPMRAALAGRFAAALERGEIASPLPPQILADSFLLSAFAAGVAWTVDSALPLAFVLRGITHLFLFGAASRGA